jgi:hypothetical protein
MLYMPREEGQGLVEYALILVLVAVVVIVILALVLVPSATLEPPTPSPTPVVIAMVATSATMPEDLIIPQTPEAVIAAAPTESISLPSSTTPGRSPSQWLVIALLVQVGLLLVAGLEFLRRARRRS